MAISLEEFFSLTSKFTVGDDCWQWLAGKTAAGYGQHWIGKKNRLAHRVTYTLLAGEIPEGLELDHTCSNRGCVNPAHLEPVTHAENVRRGRSGEYLKAITHCPEGHPYSGSNLYIPPNRTGRECRKCRQAAVKRFRMKKEGY